MAPMAHANDFGGSIRYPAAWCGLFGLKPSRARVSLGPEYGDVGGGLAVEHALTRSVRDSAALLDAVAGPAPGDPYWAPPVARPFAQEVRTEPGRLRIAVTTRPRGEQRIHPDYQKAADETIALLTELGHDVEEAMPAFLDEDAYGEAVGTMYRSTFPWIVAYWVRKLGREPGADDLEPVTRFYYEAGKQVSAVESLLAVEELQRATRRLAVFLEGFDVWMTPTLGGPPVRLGILNGTETDPLAGHEHMGTFLMFDGELANISGNPAMSIPLATDSNGLPIGIHFLGRFGDEATLFRLAGQLEQARPWADRRPGVSA
jgi:amidase